MNPGKNILVLVLLLFVSSAAYAAGNSIALQATGNCVEKPVIVSTTLNGNPLAGAAVEIKNSSKSSNFTTDSSGTISVMFNEAGIYEFKATKGALSSDSIAIQVISCETSNAVVDLCTNVNCDDANSCTADNCFEGACNHANLDGTSCGNGSCSRGVCVQPVSASGSDAGAQETTGLAVFGQNINLIAGFALVYLVVAAYFFLKVRKKK